jgi:hypothetical protein
MTDDELKSAKELRKNALKDGKSPLLPNRLLFPNLI